MAARQLRTVFPHLGEPVIERFCNGVVAVTLDWLPRFTELDRNLFAGFGYSGRGIAMSTGMGALLAERVSGVPRHPEPAEAGGIPQSRHALLQPERLQRHLA